jgi:predicted secreted acid phosphatase
MENPTTMKLIEEKLLSGRYPLIDKTQMFDLQADPHEMNDLADKPESADKIKELTALLEKTRKEFGDKAPLVVPNPKPAAWSPGKAGGGKIKGKNGQKPEDELARLRIGLQNNHSMI